jgi:basic amino acid/polyamine antiporter, APA family
VTPRYSPHVSGRTLTLFDVLCLGVNAIVGSGIYAFPGQLAGLLGPASFLAFGLCGLIAALIGLCFAEAAARFDRSGGPYVYARAAFGAVPGYLIGWTCWAAALLSWAAVARAIPPYLGQLWPAAGEGWGSTLAATGIVFVLGGINFFGIRPGALTTDVLTIAKLLPLFVLVGAGLLRRGGPRGPFAPHGLSKLPRAAFKAFFAFQGFEVVPVPAGETANPRRNAPLAVLGSLAGSTILYMVIQHVAVATTPTLADATQPLAEMGRVLLGAVGSEMVAAAAVISMLGFCAGVAFAGPRYVEALAADGDLPAAIAARHARFGTPHLAILLTTSLTAALVVLLDFGRLVDLSVLTVSVQYLATCVAIPVLRWRHPERGAFRLPGGPLIPIAACAVTIWLASHAGRVELVTFASLLAVGIVPALTARLVRRSR